MTIRNSFPDVRPALNLDFANTKRLDPRITFTRSSTGTYVDEFGIIKTAASNEARFDHDSDGNSLGLLVEESRINYATQSESFSGWNVQQLTQSTASGVVAPDGTTGNVQLFTEDETSNVHRLFLTSSAGGATDHAHTIFAKVASGTRRLYLSSDNSSGTRRTLIFDLSNETYDNTTDGIEDWSNITIQAYPNGWYRVGAVIEDNGGNTLHIWGTVPNDNNSVSFVGDGTSGIYLWGAQLEQGSFPTSYIPTSGSTATRSADVASMTGTNFSSWYNQTEGTISAKCSINADPAGNAYVFSLHGPIASQERIAAYINSSTRAGWVVTTSSVNQAGSNYGDHLAPNGGKFIIGYKLNDFAFDTSLGPIKTDSSGTPSSSINSLSIAALESGSSLLNGHISRLTYYDRRLTDAQLQALTL